MASKSSRSDSEKSIESIGLGPSLINASSAVDVNDLTNRLLPKLKEFSFNKLEPEGGQPIDDYMFDCIVYVIYCPQHKRIVLSSNERTKAVWFPFIVYPQNKTWSDATSEGISIIFNRGDSEMDPRLVAHIPIEMISCIQVLRIQLPTTKKFIYRLMQLIVLGNNTELFKCCVSNKRLNWVDLKEALTGNIDKLWGPEVPLFCSYINDPKTKEISENGLEQIYCFVPKNPTGTTPEEKIMISLRIGKKEIEQVYSDFLEHCFPSSNMTYWSFSNYINEYIHEYDNQASTMQLFQAFNFNRNGFLSFQEFLFGLACIEPECPNNEVRNRFIFRYYDFNKDDFISQDEFNKMMNDLKTCDPDYRLYEIQSVDNAINWQTFNEIIDKEFIRTETLCRSSSPILIQICANFQKRNDSRISVAKQNLNGLKQPDKSKGSCLNCRERKYEYGSHCVRFDQNGRCVEPRNILECDVDCSEEQENEMTMRKYSQDYVFSTVSIGHTFLDMIREFNNQRKKEKIGFFTNKESHEIFTNYVNILCKNVRSLLEYEDKLIKINSPCYVIGDIKGDLNSLISLEQTLWQSIPVIPQNYVFLGNYVNDTRQQYSIECVLYLFALKIIAPNKIFLLRGNNEIRNPKKNSKFQNECLDKYGLKYGTKVFDMVNDVFDKMALAIIIDESIFCVNSGIPDSSATIEDIYNIPKDLKDPMSQPIAKEILANTKCTNEQIMEFLDQNGLSFIIRSNQFLEKGFRIDVNGRSINVSTLPNTQQFVKGNIFDLTVVCVSNPKIQIVKLETTVEKSAINN